MFLSDKGIIEACRRGHIRIHPYDELRLQPASYDVALGDSFALQTIRSGLDLTEGILNPEEGWRKMTKDVITILPGEFVLGATAETITLDRFVLAQLNGKSSLARVGLIIHATAGFIDPGYDGQITLEMLNISRRPIRIAAGQPIGQLVFARLETPARFAYGSAAYRSHYGGKQEGVQLSRYGMKT